MVVDRSLSDRKIEIPSEETDVVMAPSRTTRMQSYQFDNRLEFRNPPIGSRRLLPTRIIPTLEIIE